MPDESAAAPALRPPGTVLAIARRLEEAGHETWCVGGAVRDALLGLPHLDWDLATAARPAQVRRLFRRTVPLGEQFGTIGVLDEHGGQHEVTTFRLDVRTDGRHAVVEFGASLDEDLARRDFTINAIAYSPSRRELHDPYGGRADLARRVVRAVGNPRQRMIEDRLRALRALRFAGRFGFTIEPETWNAIVESATSLDRLSKERIQQELVKTLEQVRKPSQSLELWMRSGALKELLPALARLGTTNLRAADHVAHPDSSGDPGIARRRTMVRLAALLANMPSDDVSRLLSGLRFSNRDVTRITHLTRVARTFRGALSNDERIDDPALRRWASEARRVDVADALRVAIASLTAESEVADAARVRWRSVYRRAVRIAWRDPVEVADLAVDGEDLMRTAAVPAGPQLGVVLRGLLSWVVEDPARNTRDALLDRARVLQDSSRG